MTQPEYGYICKRCGIHVTANHKLGIYSFWEEHEPKCSNQTNGHSNKPPTTTM